MWSSRPFMNSVLDRTETLTTLGLKHFKSEPDMFPLCMAAVQTTRIKLDPNSGRVKSEDRGGWGGVYICKNNRIFVALSTCLGLNNAAPHFVSITTIPNSRRCES